MDKQFLIDTGKEDIEQMDELAPVLLVEHGDHVIDMVVLAGGHPYPMLMAMLPMLREMQPTSMALTTDTYIITGELGDEEEVMAVRERYGNSLQAAFEAGEPLVSEALHITMVDRFKTEVVTLPYTRTKGGITWAEPKGVDGAEVSGRMIDVLRAVWS